MKSSSQKAAKKRRHDRAKELQELGKAAESKLAAAEREVEAARAEVERLRQEVVTLRADHGRATTQLAEIRRENESLTVLLDGLRVELTEADELVRATEREKVLATTRVSTLDRELAEARLADSDAKSLRTRLANKSREIDDLRSKLNRAEAALAEQRRSKPLVMEAKQDETPKPEA